MPRTPSLGLCHWGAFEATVEGGRLTATRPWRESDADPEMIGAWPDLVYSSTRIDQPYVRRSYLERGLAAGGALRGQEEMVPVPWNMALDLAANALRHVYKTHGPSAVFGGSYGWSSAGRFHHARSQVRRFLAAAGGFTDQVGNYSWGAAHALLPHVLGDVSAVSSASTAWSSIETDTDVLVAFGGLNPKNWRVTSGGAGEHHLPRHIEACRKRGVRFVMISPNRDDVPEGIDADWVSPRPNTDTAIMLALCHQALTEGRADLKFLQRYTSGSEAFITYLKGVDDGIIKDIGWAAEVSDVPKETLQKLWQTIRSGRVMLTASWSLQRADYGEQSYWALIALAAMLGQIGLPGGGFTFGYGSMNGVGASARRGFVPSLKGLPNPCTSQVPAAAFPDMLQNPRRTINFNGRALTYPETQLIYWAGGNPFHHAQDLFALEEAWRRPQTVIVNEPWWTPTAKRADIVFPATTSVERNDIGGTSRDPYVFMMPKLIEQVGQARDDFQIFQALAERLDCRAVFDEGRTEEQWLRHLWRQSEQEGERTSVNVPDFETFRDKGYFQIPRDAEPEILLSDFFASPEQAPLATLSGRIELYSSVLASFGGDGMSGHPKWFAPSEWLGCADNDELHLLSNQPARQLHSQLFQTRQETGPQPVTLNPADANRNNIADGALVELFNSRGSCLARARVSDSIRPGVAVIATGAWFEPDGSRERFERNGNPNVLTATKLTSDLGQACAAQSTLIRIRLHVSDGTKD